MSGSVRGTRNDRSSATTKRRTMIAVGQSLQDRKRNVESRRERKRERRTERKTEYEIERMSERKRESAKRRTGITEAIKRPHVYHLGNCRRGN